MSEVLYRSGLIGAEEAALFKLDDIITYVQFNLPSLSSSACLPPQSKYLFVVLVEG